MIDRKPECERVSPNPIFSREKFIGKPERGTAIRTERGFLIAIGRPRCLGRGTFLRSRKQLTAVDTQTLENAGTWRRDVARDEGKPSPKYHDRESRGRVPHRLANARSSAAEPLVRLHGALRGWRTWRLARPS